MSFKKGQLLVVDNLNYYNYCDENWAVWLKLKVGQYLIATGDSFKDRFGNYTFIGVEGHGLAVPIGNLRAVDIMEEIERNTAEVVVKKEKDFQPKDFLINDHIIK